ncbi:hypothetical protein MMC13_002440 [Lambiella insularis]|nr:hypothetical protein [Lambiella insularis]
MASQLTSTAAAKTGRPSARGAEEPQHSLVASGHEHNFTTTVLVNNIHCASCVRHIEEALRTIPIVVLKVNINILSQEVLVWHQSPNDATNIWQALSDAAFEIHSISTVDQNGMAVFERTDNPEPEKWLGTAADFWGQQRHSEKASNPTLQKHIDNCAACKAGEPWSPRLSEAATQYDGEGKGYSSDKLSDTRPLIVGNARLPEASHHGASSGPHEEAESYISETSLSIIPLPTADTSLKQDPYVLVLSVGGMTCASCTGAIKHALHDLDYVKAVDVDLLTNSVRVRFIGPETNSLAIVDVISDIGYEAGIVTCDAGMLHYDDKSAVADQSVYKATLSIAGMTCAACPNAITRALSILPFVKRVNITLMTGACEVTFEQEENLSRIVETIDDVGYESTLVESGPLKPSVQKQEGSNTQTRSLQLRVDGMFCNHCPDRVVEAVQTMFASSVVIERPPSLELPLVRITYSPHAPEFTIRHIISCINSANEQFQTTVYHPPSLEERSKSMQIHERNRMLKRLIISFIVAVPTLLIGVIWMSLVSDSNPVRQFFEEQVWSGSVTRAEWALFILATPVMFFAADVFHVRAVKEIRALWRKGSKTPLPQRFYRFGSMNLLISAGTSVAYIASLALLVAGATARDSGSGTNTYFDTVVFLTFFILIGRNLEAYSKSKTGDAVAMLGKLRPQEALLVTTMSSRSSSTESENEAERWRDESQPTKTETVSADVLEVGDIVVVPHGSSPPADGSIISGSARFDESSLTGESRTVCKESGETVFAGTINVGNAITMEISKIGGTSMLDQIVSVVREGQTKRAPVERLADILTGYFVPIITALAILTFLVWLAIGQSGRLDPRFLDGQAGGWAFWSLEFAIAVFVVACPCGIGLAAPTALFVGGGLAAKHGILVRGGGEAFQEAGDLDAIVFDKTGTLTEGGSLSVTDYEIPAGHDEEACTIWSIVKSLEEQSSHPIAQAILALAVTKEIKSTSAESIAETPGLGMRGTFLIPSASESTVYEAALGSETLISSLSSPPPSLSYFTTQTVSKWKTQAKSVALLALRRSPTSSPTSPLPTPWTIAALFATSDPIRSTARPAIQALQRRGLAVYMLSGDNPATALAVAATVGIPASHVFAGVLPTQKAAKIAWLQAHSPCRAARTPWPQRLGLPSAALPPRPAKIGFVGDGINDTPALHAADVGISLATGSPIALSSSAFILLSPSLLAIPRLLDLSGRVFRRIKFNFAWALGYNVLLVPVAAGVLFAVGGGGWRLGPVWASAAMAGSSVSVVASSLALRWEGGWWVWRRRDGGDGDGGRRGVRGGM